MSANGKMACINFPTVVAAMTLYNCVPDDRQEPKADVKRPLYQTKAQYLEKAKEIYAMGNRKFTGCQNRKGS